ncbi:pilus assembly protein CpaF [Thermotomaculum hydrothermale]|uniref:Pilus assembly protein CpaF n=1 Tax=Thermotomaculum hydrothermale TaxID=981385 RepID=A0A7R6PH36_9BACT|nr:ATPase, T2SS/T4P/T4SS family [Thermotomaculum hydrothermale]BBB33604.1 pilus assembly protein CpaF [Thermotomaculum hydrothermale]
MGFKVLIKDLSNNKEWVKSLNQPIFFIGRSSSNEVVLNSPKVSSRHARVMVRGEKITIEDLKSTNGILFNNEKVERSADLSFGDSVQIGDFVISIVGEDFKTEAPVEEEQVEFKFDPFAYVRPFLAPINDFLEDASISEIMINGHDKIYIERKGKIEKTDKKFASEKALVAAVKNIARALGKEVSEINPRLDARLDDGSRVAAVIPPCALTGTYVSIRKFSKKALTLQDLINFGAITQDAIDFIELCILMKQNVIVSGGTGSGKTTLLNVLSSLIPDNERIIVIEDTAELQLQKEHILRMEAKPADKKGRGEVTIRDLLHSTLRMRPDRIVIGEIRGGEAFDLLQAMNTGHGGSMSTIHSNSPFDTLSRLENTTLQSGIQLPLKAIREQISSAINIIVHTKRFEDGSRKVNFISEVMDLKPDMSYNLQHIFVFERTGKDENGKVFGELKFTGNKPTFLEEARKAGFVKKGSFLDSIK